VSWEKLLLVMLETGRFGTINDPAAAEKIDSSDIS
jgi:hypothetical protein